MKILKWSLIVLAVVAVLAVGFLAYLGMFSPLNTYEAQTGPYTIAYESFTGPYAQTGPVFSRVQKTLKAKGLSAKRGLGIYYDDPSKVPADKLRSDCGVVIEEIDLPKLNQIKKLVKVKRLARADSVVLEFPLRNVLSYMLGPMKAYPLLMKHAQAKGYKIAGTYELYDEAQGKIFFVLQVAKK